MIFKDITVNDLQPKHSRGESADNRVRKAWALQMPDEVKAKFSGFPQSVKAQLYKSFDTEVHDIWTSMLVKLNKHAKDNGAKTVRVNGFSRLEESFCKDTDLILIEAAQVFIERFANREANNA